MKRCNPSVRRRYTHCYQQTISHLSTSDVGTSIRMESSKVSVHMLFLRTSALSPVWAFLIRTTHARDHLRTRTPHVIIRSIGDFLYMFGQWYSMTILLAHTSCRITWTANRITHTYERCDRSCWGRFQHPSGRKCGYSNKVRLHTSAFMCVTLYMQCSQSSRLVEIVL